VIVTVAPNGGRKTKADHPALPLSPDELARASAECLERGASMIHLHVRDRDGGHCLDPDAYRAAIACICQEVGDRLVIQITSESLGLFTPSEQRAAVLEANPEAVSLALRELAPEQADEKDFGLFLNKLKQMRIWPQIILYHPDEAERLGAMMKRGLIPFDAIAVLYVLGRFTLTRTAAPGDLSRLLLRICLAFLPGASARLAAARSPASPLPRCSAAMCGSASRTTLCCPTAPAPPPTPRS
jgi:3-keto-5-aminohexanoate cleavage enzyme